MRRFITRLPPGGTRISRRQLLRVAGSSEAGRSLRAGLETMLGCSAVTLHASGREALRVALSRAATQTGRQEVLIPAYTCFSVPAAAVAAGLRVRLVDVGLDGGIDPEALRRAPLERAAALVVSNLFGVSEPIAPLRAILAPQGVVVVDDAAQALGASGADGPVGGRGGIGILSFGRGKPLSGLGGGAAAWFDPIPPTEQPTPVVPRRLAALLRAAAYDLALQPLAFRALAAIPTFRIGETRYDPHFRRGPIDGASLCLAAAMLPDFPDANRERSRATLALARRVTEETDFAPLLAASNTEAVYPRLALRAPHRPARDRALRALARLGATRMYPSSLDDLSALVPHLASKPCVPGAREFAARLLTLPAGSALRGERLEVVLRALRESSSASPTREPAA